MQTHSIHLNLQINFQYPESEMNHKKALRRAIRLAMNPIIKQKLDGAQVTGVIISDPDCASIRRVFGEV